MAAPVLIFGAGQVAETAAEYFERDGQGPVAAFMVDPEHNTIETLRDRPVLTVSDAADRFPPGSVRVFVAMGYHRHAGAAWDRVRAFSDQGYELASYCAPTARVADSARIGLHHFILDYNVIQPGAVLGDHVFLMPQNNIGHHARIGDANFLAGQVCISGACETGSGCFFGVNAATADNLKIGETCRIGPGASVMTDTPAETTLIARPARSLRGEARP